MITVQYNTSHINKTSKGIEHHPEAIESIKNMTCNDVSTAVMFQCPVDA